MGGRKVMVRVRVPVVHVPALVPALGPSTKEEGTKWAGKDPVFGLHKISRWLLVASVRHKSSSAYFGLEAVRWLG